MIRRKFLKLSSSAILAGAATPSLYATASEPLKIEAVAFDAFPIFDPRPVSALAEQLFPGKGAELSNAWRTRQFEYQWLRNISRRYADFWRTTEDALVFAAQLLRLELTAERRDRLMNAYLELDAWPDVSVALHALKNAGIRLALLSNMTERMLRAGLARTRLGELFEHVLTTDSIESYKPDPRAYQMGVEAFGLDRDAILFAAFAGWDAVGAKSFGYPTFWVNRLGLPEEALGYRPDGKGPDLMALVRFLGIGEA